MRTEIEFVCAGCGGECLICDLETEVTLTHCTECANKRIRELEAKLERVRELPDRWIDKSFDPLFDVDDCADELDQALADD